MMPTFFNNSQMRKDVAKILLKNNRAQMKAAADFMSRKENKNFDLMDILSKISNANEDYYDIISSSKRSLKELDDVLTYEEKLFIAKLYRYAEECVAETLIKKYPIPKNVKVKKISVDFVSAELQIPPEIYEDRILLYFHGGGQVLGSAKIHRLFTIEIAKVTNMKVLSVNYRLAPEHPFPTGLEDGLYSYKWLLNEGYLPKNIIIGGDSSGANITLALLLKLRDKGIPLPNGAFVISPPIDYTHESKTKYSNKETDFLSDVGVFWWDLAYLAGQDPYNPYISPVHADLKGLPPILIQVSTIEMLYDHSTRFFKRAKDAGVDITLQEWDEMMHIWPVYGLFELPESEEAIEKIGQFVQDLFD